MRVYVTRKLSIEKYMFKNAESRKGFECWLSIVQYADWEHPVDMLQTFSGAELLGNGSDRVAFDIGGKAHKLICRYVFGKNAATLFVYWIGTDQEYKSLVVGRKQFSVCGFGNSEPNGISLKIIKNTREYDSFCSKLESLVMLKKKGREQLDEIALLRVLIENHDYAHGVFQMVDPVELVKNLAEDNKDRPAEISKLLCTGKGVLADTMNYRRGMTKELVRKLADRFKMREEAFDRPYNVFNGVSGKVRKSLVK